MPWTCVIIWPTPRRNCVQSLCADHLLEIGSFVYVVGHHGADTREMLGYGRNGRGRPNRRDGNDHKRCPCHVAFHEQFS